MKGRILIEVSSRNLKYSLTLDRAITLLRGDSATGKSELIRQISEYERYGKESGITLNCKYKCVARWANAAYAINYIQNTHEEILFFDETENFIKTKEFASAVRFCDNYIVLVTREDIKCLPYSIKAVQQIVCTKSGEYYVNELKEYFKRNTLNNYFRVEQIITEDSNAGNEMMRAVFKCECIPAHGNGNILNTLKLNKTLKNRMIFADGAAFGAYYTEIFEYVINNYLDNVLIWLPESFEYLILTSGIAGNIDAKYLEFTYDYADTIEYETWEQYYTQLLIEQTATDNAFRYSKRKLTFGYLQPQSIEKFKTTIPSSLGTVEK